MNKRGAAVALFVLNSIKCKTIDHMRIVIDDLIESVTIEITNYSIYRTPASGIDQFSKTI